MGDDHQGRAVAVELTQQLDDLATGPAVERTGRLVCEDDGRAADDRTRDRRALLLAAGELIGLVVEAVAQADAHQCFACALAALAEMNAVVQQATGDVVDRAHAVQQVELLEDEAHAVCAKRRQLVVRGRGGVVAVDHHVALGGAVQGAHDLQHRGLAGARGPDDGGQAATLDREVDPLERLDTAGVALADAAQLERVTILGMEHHCTAAFVTVIPGSRPSPLIST